MPELFGFPPTNSLWAHNENLRFKEKKKKNELP